MNPMFICSVCGFGCAHRQKPLVRKSAARRCQTNCAVESSRRSVRTGSLNSVAGRRPPPLLLHRNRPTLPPPPVRLRAARPNPLRSYGRQPERELPRRREGVPTSRQHPGQTREGVWRKGGWIVAEHEQYNALRYKSLKIDGAIHAQKNISLCCKHRVGKISISMQVCL